MGPKQERLDLGAGLLDRIEVRRVWQQEQEPCAGGLDRLSGALDLVGGQTVQDDDAAGAQRWGEHLPDIGDEGLAVHRAVEDHGRRETVEAQTRHQRRGLPVAVRDGGAVTLAARAAAAQARDPGGGASPPA